MKIAYLLIIPLTLSAPALAQHAIPWTLDDLIQTADLDGDGNVSRDEFLTLRSEAFTRVDTDTSGSVTQAEFAEVLSQRIQRFSGRAFARVDGNGDGIVTHAEWDAIPPTAFDRADVNGDGVLTPGERDGKRRP